MSSKKQSLVFHRTKGNFEDCDLDTWDDLAVIKAYDLSVSQDLTQQMRLTSEANSNTSDIGQMDELEPAAHVGEMVWSRTPGVEVIDQSEFPTTSNFTEATNNKVNRKRKRKRKKPSNGSLVDHSLLWEVGGSCMALYPDDQLYYKATIQAVNPEQGTVVVAYDDYDEDEVLAIKEIYPESLWTDAGINVSNATDQNQHVKGDATNSAILPSNKKKKKKKSSQQVNPGTRQNKNKTNSSPLPNRNVTLDSNLPFMPTFNIDSMPNCDNFPVSGNSMSKDAMSSMLVSWYMAGYHTGYYRGLSNRTDES